MSRDLTQKSGSCLTLGGRHVKEDLSGVKVPVFFFLPTGRIRAFYVDRLELLTVRKTMLSTRRSRGMRRGAGDCPG